ncbi:MAG: ferrous iron transport protein A [Flavobacteriales bacterium]
MRKRIRDGCDHLQFTIVAHDKKKLITSFGVFTSFGRIPFLRNHHLHNKHNMTATQQTKTLNNLQPGEGGIVASVEENVLLAKLTEMGIYRGQQLHVLYRAPLGDPIAVQVGHYVLSLRMNEASLITMEHIS